MIALNSFWWHRFPARTHIHALFSSFLLFHICCCIPPCPLESFGHTFKLPTRAQNSGQRIRQKSRPDKRLFLANCLSDNRSRQEDQEEEKFQLWPLCFFYFRKCKNITWCYSNFSVRLLPWLQEKLWIGYAEAYQGRCNNKGYEPDSMCSCHHNKCT